MYRMLMNELLIDTNEPHHDECCSRLGQMF